MSALATAIYQSLLRRVRSGQPSITYGQLAASLGKHTVHHRSPHLHTALGEVSQACRDQDLPCLPAIVWSSSLKRPSDGYYKVAHPRVRSEPGRIAAWEREHDRVLREVAKFPTHL